MLSSKLGRRSRSRRSSTSSELPFRAGFCWTRASGNNPFARPGTNTASNSRPLAACTVITFTESSSLGWTGFHSRSSSIESRCSRNARSVSSPSTGWKACTCSRNAARFRRRASAIGWSAAASSSASRPVRRMISARNSPTGRRAATRSSSSSPRNSARRTRPSSVSPSISSRCSRASAIRNGWSSSRSSSSSSARSARSLRSSPPLVRDHPASTPRSRSPTRYRGPVRIRASATPSRGSSVARAYARTSTTSGRWIRPARFTNSAGTPIAPNASCSASNSRWVRHRTAISRHATPSACSAWARSATPSRLRDLVLVARDLDVPLAVALPGAQELVGVGALVRGQRVDHAIGRLEDPGPGAEVRVQRQLRGLGPVGSGNSLRKCRRFHRLAPRQA